MPNCLIISGRRWDTMERWFCGAMVEKQKVRSLTTREASRELMVSAVQPEPSVSVGYPRDDQAVPAYHWTLENSQHHVKDRSWDERRPHPAPIQVWARHSPPLSTRHCPCPCVSKDGFHAQMSMPLRVQKLRLPPQRGPSPGSTDELPDFAIVLAAGPRLRASSSSPWLSVKLESST